MKRTLALAALAATLFTAAACGGGDDDDTSSADDPVSSEAPANAGGSTIEEVCDKGKEAVEPFITDLSPLADELSASILAGDADGQEAAVAKFDDLITRVVTDLRDAAATSSEPGLAEAFEAFADEFEKYGERVRSLDITDPSSVSALMELDGFDKAGELIGEFCD